MSWTLVTGGAKRIGAAICLALAEAGHDIVVHYHTSQKEASALAEHCRRHGVQAAVIQGDFSSSQTTSDFLSRYIEQFPDTSHLVNNVGNYFVASLLNTPVADWQGLFQTNVHAPLAIIQALMPAIRKAGGRIVNLGTCGLHTRAYSRGVAYMMTKETLLAMTRSLAKEVAGEGVTVNMVSPGQLDVSVEFSEDMARKLPMHRVGQVREVANVVTFLFHPDNGYITGQNIEVAGGYQL